MEDKTCEWCGTTAPGDAATCPICRQPFGLGIGLPAAMAPPASASVSAPARPAAVPVQRSSSLDLAPQLVPVSATAAAADEPLAPAVLHNEPDPDVVTHLGALGEIEPVDASLHHLAADLRNAGVRKRRSHGRFIRRSRKAVRVPSARQMDPAQVDAAGVRRRHPVRTLLLVAASATVLATAAMALRESLPSDQVRDTVQAYYDAGSCLDRIELVSSGSAPIARACDDTAPERSFSDIEISNVKVDGDEATAQVRVKESVDGTSSIQSFEQELVKEDGEWRLLITEE